MFPDPLVYSDGASSYNFPLTRTANNKRTYSINDGSSDVIVDISQTGSAKRARRDFRITIKKNVTVGTVTSLQSFSVIFTIDEPVGAVFSDSDILGVVHSLKATLNDTNVNKLLNGEM